MESQLSEAFYSVYISSSTIIANKQRHLFCSMLDLLTSTCKTTGLTNNKISIDDMVQFWLGDILPLTMDEDRAIQCSAVAALEQALVSLDVNEIHSCSRWPELRNAIITKYAPKINELRESKNPNWHNIWCLYIRILDKEILRGASVINSFLSIVELGFRNSDNTVRAEAFLCWRLLIKIFSAYEELSAPKRLKLVCIPLKSSQSKSAHTAAVKFRVWWYLLTCLGDRIIQNFDNVVEPFLVFTFGAITRSTTTGVAQQYRSACELALPALVAMLSLDTNEHLQRYLREFKLEPFMTPSPLIDGEVLKQHWRPILHAVNESIELFCKHDADDESTESEQQMLHHLMRNLTIAMVRLNVAPFTVQFCTDLEKFIGTHNRVVLQVFNTIATDNLIQQRDAVDAADYKRILEAFLKLCIKAKSHVPPAILQRCMGNIFANDSLHATTQSDFRVLTTLLELVMHTNDEEDYDAFEVKLKVWRQLTYAIVDYLRANNLDYRLKQNADLLDEWLVWPLQTCTGFAGRRPNALFDQDFCELWRQLLNAGHHSIERRKQLNSVKNALHELLICHKEFEQFASLFDAYVAALIKLGINKDALPSDMFVLLGDILATEALPQKVIEACLNTLRHMITGLKNNELVIVFDGLKSVLSNVVQTWRKRKYEGTFLDEWKRAILDKVRSHTNKTLINQLKELFKGNDDFVIIPTVWSLNPEKLTDRQRERFAEKADIPALYNDMSQSQDSSIKPWTPKKIVIAKNKQAEIVIEGSEKHDDIIVIEETPNALPPKNNQIEDASNKQTPNSRKSSLRTIQKETDVSAEATNPEKYNFRKTRSIVEEDNSKTATNAKQNVDDNTTKTRMLRQRPATKEQQEKPEANEKKSPTLIQLTSPKQKANTPTKAQLKKAINSNTNGKSANDALEPAADITKQSADVFAESDEPTATLSMDTPQVATAEQETELNVINIAEDVTPAIAMETENKLTEIQPTPLEVTQVQETSPKKPTTRFTGLSSPPDRKQTNNSTSPTLRPKPTGHLTGRGAQLINMIRNKKLDSGSPYALSPAGSRLLTPARCIERTESATPSAEFVELTGIEQTSTPFHSNDLLVFAKPLPSPTASPSASILKRKMRYESIDESLESPALKRKRVSFHDPPVSITKEYVRDIDDKNKTKPKRCLVLEKVGHTPDIKHALKRRSRIDSMAEIEKYATEESAKTITATTTLTTPNTNKTGNELMNAATPQTAPAVEDSLCGLRWNDSRNSSIANPSLNVANPLSTNPAPNCVTEIIEKSSKAQQYSDLTIMDTDTALDIVSRQCSLDTLLERYFQNNASPLKSVNILTKFVSKQMSNNPKIKSNVLETLSEAHSKAFLDHAVQENLSSVVCDRLNLNSVLDYICAKSKINTNCRNNLLAQVHEILKCSKADNERINFIKNLLKQSNFTDENILELISMLVRTREKRESNINESVSESAVDSSSNL